MLSCTKLGKKLWDIGATGDVRQRHAEKRETKLKTNNKNTERRLKNVEKHN